MKRNRTGALLTAIAGAAMWAFSRMSWISAEYNDDLSGTGQTFITGAEWSTEITAVAVLLIAGGVAAFALRKVGRRVVGAICALAAAGAAVPAGLLLARGADHERIHAILTAGAEEAATDTSSSTIANWAEITGADVAALGPVLTLLGCVLGLVGGVYLALKPGDDAPRQHKYEKEAVRKETIRSDLKEEPDSGRVMWDALDADIDPTAEGDFQSPRPTS